MVSVMLGRDHALLGAVGYLVVAPLAFPHLSPDELGVGCLTSAAFALLPDIDEPGSTVSRKLGPISRAISEVTNKVAGGHRQATHSLLFVALVGVTTWLAYQHRLALAIVVALSSLLVFRMLLPRFIRYALPAAIATTAVTGLAALWAWHTPTGSAAWFLLATAGGCFWHLVGDTLTVEGVPYLWTPGVHKLQELRASVPLVGHCGSTRETVVGVGLSAALLWMAASLVLVPLAHGFDWQHLVTIPHIHLPGVPSPNLHISGVHIPNVSTSGLHLPSLPHN